jgi:NAD-dependent dihydropyrimidine dehydrogenase PreA subunit
MAEQARGKIEVNQDECKGCGLCVESCPVHGLALSAELNHYGVHPAHHLAGVCTGCGICYFVCPEPGAITVYRLTVQKSEVGDAATV